MFTFTVKMKIGIIASGFEMFPLMEVLNQYDHNYHIFCDWKMRPWGDKDPELRKERIQKAITYLADKVDVFILPPVLELAYHSGQLSKSSSQEDAKAAPTVLPLFRTYLLHHAFKYSLRGKM